MSAKTVCRLCLSMNSPMHTLDDGPLRDVYEKLTNISLKTPGRPLVACLVCYSQLWKCYNLMVRSVKADEVLSQILRRGEAVTETSIVMQNSETYQLHDLLSFTPVELLTIPGSEHSLMEATDNEEPVQSQVPEENDMDNSMHAENLKCEESEEAECVARAGLENGEGKIKTNRHVHEHVRKNSKSYQLNDLLSFTPVEMVAIPGPEHRLMEATVNDEPVQSQVPEKIDVDNERHSRQQNIPEKRKERSADSEIESTTGTDVSASTETAAGMMEVSRNTSRCTDTATYRGNVSVDSDNECTTAGTDGDSRGEHLTNTYVCDDCGDMFDDKHLLIQHVEHHDTDKRNNQKSSEVSVQECITSGAVNKHTETQTEIYPPREKLYECATCLQRFAKKSNLNRHLRIHTKEQPFECTVCQRRFAAKHSLNRHLRMHTKEKPFQCIVCQRKFSDKSHLNIHLRIHSKEKPFECIICQRSFSNKSRLNTHLRIHTKETSFECAICLRRFADKNNLNRHLQIHIKETPFECTICQRRFTGKDRLNRHSRIHTNEKPFECAICQRRFAGKEHLLKHLRIHTKEKAFECIICQRIFSDKSHLNTHLRIHTKDKPFECVVCQRTFSQKSALNRHSRTVHGVPPHARTRSTSSS